MTVTVTPVNDAPAASADSASVAEDGTVSIPVLANDTDADNDTLTVSAVTQGTHGSVTINPDKIVTYTPAANFNGSDSFTYTISDGHGGTATASVNVTVTPVNDAPVANADAATTPEDTAVTASVLANDTDLDGHTLSVASVTQGVKGSVVINPNGTVTYTPNADSNGSDAFTYTASDGNGGDGPRNCFDHGDAGQRCAGGGQRLGEHRCRDGRRDLCAGERFRPGRPVPVDRERHPGGARHGGRQCQPDRDLHPGPRVQGQRQLHLHHHGQRRRHATATVTLTVLAPPRIATNLQVLYDFAEGSGSVVHDVSGVGTALNLTVSNPAAVSWLPGALSVNSATVIQSAGTATKVITACQASNAITIAAWVQPDSLTQSGPAHIVTLSQAGNKRNFTLGQSASRYEGMLRTSNTNQAGTSTLFGTGSATLQLTHVVYTRNSSGNVRTYINGTLLNERHDHGDLLLMVELQAGPGKLEEPQAAARGWGTCTWWRSTAGR